MTRSRAASTRPGTTGRRSTRRSPGVSSTATCASSSRGLPEKLAARVARLVAAGQLIDTDPQTAYQHTLAARARAARIAVVREACGEAAYAAGEFAEALSEFRAAKRMNGVNDYLPLMADCERALGRPDKALALAKSPAVANLAGAAGGDDHRRGRRASDLGELDAALRTLENAPLRSRTRAPWWCACATPTPTPCWPPAARRRPWSGSTAPPVSTARGSPTRPSGSARSRARGHRHHRRGARALRGLTRSSPQAAAQRHRPLGDGPSSRVTSTSRILDVEVDG